MGECEAKEEANLIYIGLVMGVRMGGEMGDAAIWWNHGPVVRKKSWGKEVNPSIAQFTSTFAGKGVGVHGWCKCKTFVSRDCVFSNLRRVTILLKSLWVVWIQYSQVSFQCSQWFSGHNITSLLFYKTMVTMVTPVRAQWEYLGPMIQDRTMAMKERWKSNATGGTKKAALLCWKNPHKTFQRNVIHTISIKDTQTLAQKSSAVKIPYSCGKVYLIQNQLSHLHLSKDTSDTRLQAQQSMAPEYTETKHSIDFDRTEVLTNIKTCHLHIIKTVKLPHNFSHEGWIEMEQHLVSPVFLKHFFFTNQKYHTLHLPTLFWNETNISCLIPEDGNCNMC